MNSAYVRDFSWTTMRYVFSVLETFVTVLNNCCTVGQRCDMFWQLVAYNNKTTLLWDVLLNSNLLLRRCDSGGDCECLCSAIADFAAACLRVGICVDWRSQHFCRKFIHKLGNYDNLICVCYWLKRTYRRAISNYSLNGWVQVQSIKKYIAPLQDTYSEALPTQAKRKRSL